MDDFRYTIGIFDADAYGENDKIINTKVSSYIISYIIDNNIIFNSGYIRLDDNAKIKDYPVADIYSIKAIKIK